MSAELEGQQLRRLLNIGQALVAEHEPEAVLDRILEEAREITGARYAALGVLNEERSELARFITAGIDTSAHGGIGNLPRGRGVLGLLIADPRPLRLSDVGDHPQSYGFPMAHPAMRSFLGVPIMIRGQAWGNLYLTDKNDADEFTDEDEQAVVVLAQWAGTAIENARLYESSERRREQLERAVRSLEAARDIADAISGASDLTRVLELIVKRGRSLVNARSILIMLREGDDLVIAAGAGHVRGFRGRRIPIESSTSGRVLERGTAERVTDTSQLRVGPADLGVSDAHSALLVPMMHRGAGLGVLVAFDRGPGGEPFSAEDEQLLRTFAASATNAVALNRSVEADRLRATIAAADAERSRWARELHDQTLQSLGALRVTLASVAGKGDLERKEAAIRQAIEDIELEIDNLRGIITDLRPSMLDDLGLLPALEALFDRRREGGLAIETELVVPPPGSGEPPLDPELETTIYRLVQESLTNTVKHANADRARVSIVCAATDVTIEVDDDGKGFDAGQPTSGFGLAGMQERVYLVGGTLEIDSPGKGTRVRARLPRRGASAGAGSSRSDQLAS